MYKKFCSAACREHVLIHDMVCFNLSRIRLPVWVTTDKEATTVSCKGTPAHFAARGLLLFTCDLMRNKTGSLCACDFYAGAAFEENSDSTPNKNTNDRIRNIYLFEEGSQQTKKKEEWQKQCRE
ncbi:hypothetical protein RB195_008265 [Necator americanus]|uniref:Uncharacterized protein n=1 Tax=Necator americanus TaxID=51031 RepID=A0ABR1CR43_NECAM